MSSSKKQLILFSIAGGLFTALILTGIVGNVVRGNYMAIPVVGGVLLLAVGVIWLGIWLNQRRIQIMFRSPTPDKLIANYHATLLQARARKIPHADAAAAHLSALAATVYGQFDLARQELAAVDWDDAPAMYRGHRLHMLALIALLEKHDTAGALRLAAEAQALERTDPAGSLPILHDAIVLAAGEHDDETVKRVKKAAERKVGALPALSSWALSLHFDRVAQAAEAARYRERVRAAAPYFVGLTSGTA
jgi:hypothetical protein